MSQHRRMSQHRGVVQRKMEKKYSSSANVGLNWIECSLCKEWILYENSGIKGKFDKERIEKTDFECRGCQLNLWKQEIIEWKNGMDAWKEQECCMLMMEARIVELDIRMSGIEGASALCSSENVEEKMAEVKDEQRSLSEMQKVVDESVLKLEQRMSDVEQKLISKDDKKSDLEVKDIVEKMTESVIGLETNVIKLGEKQVVFDATLAEMSITLSEVGEHQKTLEGNKVSEIHIQNLAEDWPKLERSDDGWTKVQGKQAKKQQRNMDAPGISSSQSGKVSPGFRSFADKCKNFKEGTVTIVGDSMVRGVGKHLKADNKMFSNWAFGGAKIEDIGEKLQLMGDKPDTHLIVMVGTNNLCGDGTEMIMEKHKNFVQKIKGLKLRKVTCMGILRREDITRNKDYMESKRISINMRIEELCKENKIEFLNAEIEEKSMLDWRGLHLNELGQDTVARAVFKHSTMYLN